MTNLVKPDPGCQGIPTAQQLYYLVCPSAGSQSIVDVSGIGCIRQAGGRNGSAYRGSVGYSSRNAGLGPVGRTAGVENPRPSLRDRRNIRREEDNKNEPGSSKEPFCHQQTSADSEIHVEHTISPLLNNATGAGQTAAESAGWL